MTNKTNTKPDSIQGEKLSKLAEISNIATEIMLTKDNPFEQAANMSKAIIAITDSIDDAFLQQNIMPLAGRRLGFRTDKDYPLAVVKECFIDATLRGLPSVGNCWNIIAGNSYVTKEGFWYLLKNRIPELTDIKIDLGVPTMKNGGAVVTAGAKWRLEGKEDSLTAEIPIRVNKMMGTDAILGKAERKLLARVYTQITGTNLGEGDVQDNDTPRNVTREKPTGERLAEPIAPNFPTVDKGGQDNA